ncbi:MAG: ABC transporter permease [Flavobacteriales bacterium]|jgi:putative ABC transport system permease protein|nr:ABC transporter permease [Flavobacteriales bacterium]
MQRNVLIAIDSIMANKLRAVLTTLGIIFGVAAVIAMLAIGNGAQQKILEQLKIVGANNVFIKANFSSDLTESGEEEKKTFSPGLTMSDFKNIKGVVPSIKLATPQVAFDCYANSSSKREKTKLVGVNADYFQLFSLELQNGAYFSESHNLFYKKVCVLGGKISKKLFPNTSPIGKVIRVKNLNLTVIGVLQNLSGVSDNLQDMGINDYNAEIYIPIQTMLLRYKDRSSIQVVDPMEWVDEDAPKVIRNPNQLDKITIQFSDAKELQSGVLLLERLLNRRHNNATDYSLVIPEQLLKQQKETDDLFNLLLGAIASISLLVGGIGIMNIMLASVMERIKEIGLRMAIGATKRDIKAQFVFEALFISLSGGIAGILLGVLLSYLIETLLLMPVMISNFSIFISFFISVLVGIIFGYLPAKKAAEQNPVTSLRYE